MGKKKSSTPPESFLLLPSPPSSLPIVDTHTHLASTFSFYRTRYKSGTYTSVHEFAQAMYAGRQVEAIVDVWCEAEAPAQGLWREFADSALRAEDRERVWGGMEYWFVMGVHPHEAKLYTDDVETHILEAMAHPRCVGWGEIGLDYHYTLSPRDTQQAVFARQLRHAVRLGKPLTIHTREAEEDTERILKAEVPREHKIHIHCFTDSPAFAARLLAHFPNLYIGITGVITYTTNPNTSGVIRNLVSSPSSRGPTSEPQSQPHLRILLETDAPYMVPANLYDSLLEMKGKLPLCHSAMVPWTAAFVARVAREVEAAGAGAGEVGAGEGQGKGAGAGEGEGEGESGEWTADRVMREARENARRVYGV
ncbi:putative tatD related DNase [Lyophyllum shimeji]|uniref:TatD related DNase n=1 Tax=Lyophyllum shimeji TaxID=47721 RepID=A0A9P3PP50_LYOSH|nr:putative tatD related DNase [Lyophyllum shimeji]